MGRILVTDSRLAGFVLIASSLVFLAAATLYTIRAIWNRPIGNRPGYFLVERGLVIAALLVAAVGLTLLARLLENEGDAVIARIGWVLFIAAAGLAVFAEVTSMQSRVFHYPPIVAFVVLALLAEALFGISLIRTGFLPAWVGWAAVLWNLGLLVYLPIMKSNDMYYPWLHYAALLLIGIMILNTWQAR